MLVEVTASVALTEYNASTTANLFGKANEMVMYVIELEQYIEPLFPYLTLL